MNTFRIVGTLTMCALLLAACGGSNKGSSSSPFTGDILVMDAPSQIGGDAAYKTKLLRVPGNDMGTFKTVLVSIYGNGVGMPVWDWSGATHAARDIFVTRSEDGGATWSMADNVSNTAFSSSISADHDGDPMTPALPFAGDSGKPTVFSTGKNISIIWEDTLVDGSVPGPAANQGSAVYPESGNIEVPYRAIYIARSSDAGVTWNVQRMGDGSRDAKQSVCRGTSAGWAYTWQEDPEGLQPGDAEGPGDGGSGAKVSKETDIWMTSQTTADFGAATALPAPVRVTDNLGGNTGASRCNMTMFGSHALIAYEETKGSQGLDQGKYVRYHVFTNFLNPVGSDASMGAGYIISNPNENARRVRIMIGPGGAAGPSLGTKICFIWKQGLYDQGGPSDIMSRVGYADGTYAPAPSDGTRPDQLVPAVDPGATDPMNATNNAPAMNLSSVAGLTAGTDDNNFEDARAHRGIIRGDSIFMGYTYTADWAVARYTDLANYNFFVRRSTDGGMTWSTPFNISGITDTKISVREPRIVGTPKSSDPMDPQDPNVAYIAWGTEVNQYEHQSQGVIDLDIFITRTTDLGVTFLTPTALADGPNAQFESQIRTTPDGLTMWAVWNEYDALLDITKAMFRTSTP
ncbi:MAG: choice-of-anchor O protein [Planctomycetota bacterium]|nr:choice-of-anchor O protein [Planctomycetota bacterium]